MASRAVATQQQGGEVAQQSRNPLVHFRGQLETRANEFKMVLPAHITPEKFQRTILTAVQADPDLLKADRQSLVLACMKAAQDGLLPDKREAALVIFSTRQKDASGQWVSVKQVQYMPMVFGLRKKILQSGEISSIETNVVYRAEVEAGAFIFEAGTEAMLRHRPMLELTEEETADDQIVAAYSVAVMKDGTKSFEVMRRSEINKVREKSQTGALKDRFGKDRTPSGPWVDWFGEMARKTVMRRHSKTLPMSGDLLDIEARDEEIAARSATALMGSVEADEARALPPTREEVENRAEHDGWVARFEAGEVLYTEEAAKFISRLERLYPDLHARAMAAIPSYDPHTGEVDEDTARALDAQTYAAAEGRSDEEHGDQHPGDDDDAPHPFATLAASLKARAERAETIIDLGNIEAELGKHRDAAPADLVEAVDQAISERAAALKGGK